MLSVLRRLRENYTMPHLFRLSNGLYGFEIIFQLINYI